MFGKLPKSNVAKRLTQTNLYVIPKTPKPLINENYYQKNIRILLFVNKPEINKININGIKKCIIESQIFFHLALLNFLSNGIMNI